MRQEGYSIKIGSIFLIILFLCLSASLQASAEELYFNDAGDMIFSAYDRKATGGTRYRTVGWVIKRYDDAINAAGQYSVNIPKSGYIYEIVDPENPEYLYTVFVIDGSMIQERISWASSEWRQQLQDYGGYVYIDSIMTVSERGVEQGGVYGDGRLYGEVYSAYEGIRNARGWQDGDKLAAYYGLKVKYPYKKVLLDLRIVDDSIVSKYYESLPEYSFHIGAGRRNEEDYDVSQGIPAGEDLYLSGTADAFRYCVDYQEISGEVWIPVKITTIYRLKWCDTRGDYRVEDQAVERWYYVKRRYSYTDIKNAQEYDLSGIRLCSGCFSDVFVNGTEERGGIGIQRYGGSINHIRLDRVMEGSAGVVEVNSSNWQRPSIPDENQQSIAEGLVPELSVWSDRLTVNGRILLSDETAAGKGKSLTVYGVMPQMAIYKENIRIPVTTANLDSYEGKAVLNYVSASGTVKKAEGRTNRIVVHTPVTAELRISGERANNENVTPSNRDLVLGDKFAVNISSIGNHKSIKGYGERNYTDYVKKWYVYFPFPVNYGLKSYEENTWIEMKSSIGVFRLQTGVKEGEYEVSCRVVADNLPGEFAGRAQLDSVTQSRANLDIFCYCASDTCKVNVIGKIYGFTLENEGKRYKAGVNAVFPELLDCSGQFLPAQLSLPEQTDSGLRVGIYSAGIGDEPEENVDIDVSYEVLDVDAEGNTIRKPADIYLAADESFTAESLGKMPERVTMTAEDLRTVKNGIYHYSKEIRLTEKLVVVEKGRDISDISMLSEYIIRDRDILMHLDIYAADGSRRKLSYENAANEPRGYCNMWKKEGYDVDKNGRIPLKCGDVLILGTEGILKNKSHIIGTH